MDFAPLLPHATRSKVIGSILDLLPCPRHHLMTIIHAAEDKEPHDTDGVGATQVFDVALACLRRDDDQVEHTNEDH
jgi:hypothetical protein